MKTCLEGTDNLVKRGGDAELLGLAGLDPPRGDLYAQKQVPVCLAPTRSHSRKRDTSLHNQTSTLAGTGFAKKKGEKNGHNCETWKKKADKKGERCQEGGRKNRGLQRNPHAQRTRAPQFPWVCETNNTWVICERVKNTQNHIVVAVLIRQHPLTR